MKKLFTTICFLALFTGTLQAQLIPELLYYKFEGSGTSVINYASAPPVGTATATIMGAVTQGGSGICGGTIIGSGITSTTDFLNTGWATNLSGTSWTISFRSNNIAASATLYYCFGDAGATSFRCFTNGVAGANNWILRGGGLTDILISGGATVAPHMNTWVYDMSLGNVKAYLDGVLVNTVAQGVPTIAGAGPFKFNGYSANVGNPAGGQYDEFRVYSRALSAAEVAQLYNPWTTSGFLGGDASFCNGDSVQLSIGTTWPYSSVSWSSGETTPSIYADMNAPYIATLSGTCGAGADTVNVAVSSGPAVNLGSDSAFCNGGSLMLDAGAGASSYSWSTMDTLQMITISSGGSYYVEVTDTGGCSASDTIVISLLSNPSVNLGADQSFCPGGSAILDAGSGFVMYNWSTADSIQMITVNAAGSYSVMVNDTNGCSGQDTIVVNEFIPSTVNLGADTSFCEGSSIGLDAGAGFSSYLWNTSDSTQMITVNAAGPYSVSILDVNGCSANDTIVISEDPLPVAGFTNAPVLLAVTFTNTSTNGTTYAWDFGDAGNSSLMNPSHTYAAPGTYTVTLIVTNDCGSDTTTSSVTVTSTGIADSFSYNLELYPNPASGSVFLNANFETAHNLEISILAFNGQVLHNEKLGNLSGSLQHSMNLNDFSAGIYFVKISSSEGFAVRKLVIE